MESIVLLGLGPGDPHALTLEAQEVLQAAREIVIRTSRHPTAALLPAHLRVRSYDALYRNGRPLTEVYAEIARDLVDQASRTGSVIYAVPGHPLIGDASVQDVLALIRERGLSYRVVAGVSFLEPVFTALEVDPLVAGVQIIDATRLAASYGGPNGKTALHRDPFAGSYRPFDPTVPVLVAQLHDRRVADALTHLLLSLYPAEHEVVHVRATGARDGATVARFPVEKLNRQRNVDHLSCLYLPPLPALEDLSSFETLRRITARLRAPGGCPWDREQTHPSLKPYLLEETYEVLEALDLNDPSKLTEELGDLLLQVVLHAQLAVEYREFTLDDVIAAINSKLIRRHPHVFGDRAVADVAEVLRNWEAIKKAERAAGTPGGAEGAEPRVLARVPPLLPSLARSQAIQKRVARAGFDWREDAGALQQVREELAEFAATSDPEQRRDELGDLLFAVVSLARRAGVDAEEALRLANLRFIARFERLEDALRADGKTLSDLSERDLLDRWRATKVDDGG